MVSKKKLLGLAVVLGFILGGVIALVRMPKREADEKVKVRGEGEQRNVSNSSVQPVTSNLPSPSVTQSATTNLQLATSKPPNPQTPKPPKVRKPIANDPKIPKARQVLLANRRIAVATGRSFPKKFCAAQTPTSRGTAPYVVISELPVSRDVRIQAVADGAKVVGFLPNNALLVEADQAALKNLEEDVLFLAAVEYEPTDKIQRALLDTKGEAVEATVVLLNPQDRDVVQKFVTENGGTLLRGAPSEKSVSANIPRGLVGQLAGKAEVKWIERYARLKALNDLSVQPACMNVTPVWNLHGLDGTGEVVAIDDTGLDKGSTTDIHRDFSGKVVALVDISGMSPPWPSTTCDACGHGTHVAGSAVGTGAASDGQYAGVAKGAKLYFQAGGAGTDKGDFYFYGLTDLAELFAPNKLQSDNYITSISLGSSVAGAYTRYCRIADLTMWNYPELLVVIANGNSGPGKQTVSAPAAAKNCLSVGNSYSTRNGGNPAAIVSGSSRGPCADGRIKPDVTAPGQRIISTRSRKASGSGDYTTMSGTSMATPHVAGAAAVVRQWLRRDRGFDNKNHKPSGALMKAILTGGANGGTKPDNDFGWGRVDLEATMFPTNGTGVFLADWLPFGKGSNFTFRVTTTNAAPLDVQLVWTDYPAEVSAAKTLVNDLDLSVCADGQTWIGNGGTQPDDVNPVESVRIPGAVATTYLVRINCTAIPYDFEEGGAAAIYIRGAFDPNRVKRGEPVGTVWTIR